jgi:toxin-antitoxin system PIN domain toxin
MIHLLDANVLIALGDANHPHRVAALKFFEKSATLDGWATCPLTENAFIRILGSSSYPNGLGSTAEARRLLDALRAAPGHQFWPDDVSLSDTRLFPSFPSSKHLTDLYLLGLAVKHGGRLATFDTSIDASLVLGGSAAHYLIPESLD